MATTFRSLVFLSLTTLLPLAAQQAHAQQPVPNGNFDNWRNRTVVTAAGPVTYRTPTDWDAGVLSLFRLYFQGQAPQLERTQVAHNGTAALRLYAPAHDSIGADAMSYTTYADQPTTVSLWYRTNYQPSGNTAPSFSATLTQNGNGVAMAGGELSVAAVNTWQQATLPLQYFGSTTPDSLIMLVMLPGDSAASAERELIVDEITFSNAPTGLGAGRQTAATRVFPTVVTAADAPVLAFASPQAGSATLTVADALGRAVGAPLRTAVAAGPVNLPLPAGSRPAGVYWATVTLPNGAVQRARFVQQ